jgi:protein ImuB
VEAEPVPLAALQTDLFAPPRPSPRELGEIIGRLVALVGADRVGAPVVPDTHRPDGVLVTSFPGGPPERVRDAGDVPSPWATGAALIRRRLTPPRPAQVECRGGRPAGIEAEGLRGAVVALAGPGELRATGGPRRRGRARSGTSPSRMARPRRLAQDLDDGEWRIDALYD